MSFEATSPQSPATMDWMKSTQTKWTLFGIIFGSLFPIVGTLLQIRLLGQPFSLESAFLAQGSEQILWIVDLAPFVLGIVFHIIGRRERELQAINANLRGTNRQLTELQSHLELRVQERTEELEQVNQKNRRRAEQFEAIGQVARYIGSIQNIDTLLPQITSVISQQFDFYHVGIFLIDATGEYATLYAANSEGGQRMLARNHRLRVGSEGIVGYATGRKQARIALDVGVDSVFFNNPDLPETRSEVALPLTDGKAVIGALDVQSTEPNAFSAEDIDTLSTLAEQVSAAIQNTRLHEDTRDALALAESAYRQLTSQTWSRARSSLPVIGYRYDGVRPEPITRSTISGQAEALGDAYSIPIHIRGEAIGKLRIRPISDEHQWTDDELAIIQSTAERVALAMERTHLLEVSQRQAIKEQKIGEITSKIGASINMRNVLQTAVEELGKSIPGSEILIQFQ